MSKQDQATRIAGKAKMLFCGSLGDTATYEAEQIEKDIRRAITAAVRKERERCIKCAESEPELPGPMPDEMWKLLSGNRYATQRALVVSVQETKVSIVEAIRKGKA